jgi:GT2 family glycosyltransferase
MKISVPNTLYRTGDYQGSLIGYLEYAVLSGLQRSSISVNIEAARRQLHEKLLQLASKPKSLPDPGPEPEMLPAVLSLPALPLLTSPVQETIATFWRLDCLVSAAQAAGADCPGFEVQGLQLQPARDAHGSAGLHTAVFHLAGARCFSDRFTGSARARLAAVAWSVRRLTEREFLANLLEEAKARLQLAAGGTSVFEEDVLVEALRACMRTASSAGEAGNLLRRLVLRHQADLARIRLAVSQPPRNSGQEAIAAYVQDKHALAGNVNFFLEGAKHYHGLVIIHGWLLDPTARISSIRARVRGRDAWHELLHARATFPRVDVARGFGLQLQQAAVPPGFAACFEIGASPPVPAQVEIIVSCRENGTAYAEQLRVVDLSDQAGGLDLLLGIIPEGKVTATQCHHFYGPLFSRSILARAGTAVAARDFPGRSERGGAQVTCTVSIIIPLYGPKRFETTQLPVLAALGRPDWQIVLAVDDPAIEEEVLANARRLSTNYSLDIRVVCAASNLGFAGINNQAARAASGKYLLFLNSDCFITAAEPVARAMAWLGQDEAHGACGFRLHYANMNIQHDGMSDSQLDGDPAFHLNQHPRIGLPASSIPEVLEADDARLLTAACLMMPASVFQEVGGFDECYLRGDFEDSDLCLKLLRSGRRLGIVRMPGIFHLERQSIGGQEPGVRQKITLFNSWLYSLRWGSLLEAPLPRLELAR